VHHACIEVNAEKGILCIPHSKTIETHFQSFNVSPVSIACRFYACESVVLREIDCLLK